ncbi:hypothetical protein [Siphonobacter aquaeclarae]|nr:hypothetical protein [Siphonobacter aquaeclarae]
MGLYFLAGCEKIEMQTEPADKVQMASGREDYLPTTAKEKELVVNLQKTTEVLKKLYIDTKNLTVVNASVATQVYTDESILLKDLIHPQNSRLNNSKRFKELMSRNNLELSYFTDNFWKVARLMSDSAYLNFLNSLNEPAAVTSPKRSGRTGSESSQVPQVSIYCPYSQLEEKPKNMDFFYEITEQVASVVTATADADQGTGYRPVRDENGNFIRYDEVLVDDNYCANNPTQIIGVNGIEPYDLPPSTMSAFVPGTPVDLPGITREVKQVYVGDVKCKRQFDKLISFTGNGGGSEIRFTRADGYLKMNDGQVTADMFLVGSQTISRRNIRNENWVAYAAEWDGDWEDANKQENIAIYEEDNRNTSEFSGQVSTTLKIDSLGSVQIGPIGFKINYKSDDYIILQNNLNRDTFFSLNRIDLEGEMKDGWPVRSKNGDVSFTLNDRTFY